MFQKRRGKSEKEKRRKTLRTGQERDRERDASVWVAKRDRGLRSYYDPASPLRHQKFTSVPHTYIHTDRTQSWISKLYSHCN